MSRRYSIIIGVIFLYTSFTPQIARVWTFGKPASHVCLPAPRLGAEAAMRGHRLPRSPALRRRRGIGAPRSMWQPGNPRRGPRGITPALVLGRQARQCPTELFF